MPERIPPRDELTLGCPPQGLPSLLRAAKDEETRKAEGERKDRSVRATGARQGVARVGAGQTEQSRADRQTEVEKQGKARQGPERHSSSSSSRGGGGGGGAGAGAPSPGAAEFFGPLLCSFAVGLSCCSTAAVDAGVQNRAQRLTGESSSSSSSSAAEGGRAGGQAGWGWLREGEGGGPRERGRKARIDEERRGEGRGGEARRGRGEDWRRFGLWPQGVVVVVVRVRAPMNARDECLSVAGADDGGAVAGSARIDDGGVRLGFEATSGEEKSGRIRERPLVWC